MHAACNRTYLSLQPYLSQPATVCISGMMSAVLSSLPLDAACDQFAARRLMYATHLVSKYSKYSCLMCARLTTTLTVKLTTNTYQVRPATAARCARRRGARARRRRGG